MVVAAFSWASVGVKTPSLRCCVNIGMATLSNIGIIFRAVTTCFVTATERAPPASPP